MSGVDVTRYDCDELRTAQWRVERAEKDLRDLLGERIPPAKHDGGDG